MDFNCQVVEVTTSGNYQVLSGIYRIPKSYFTVFVVVTIALNGVLNSSSINYDYINPANPFLQ
jgi:hypothetical protein